MKRVITFEDIYKLEVDIDVDDHNSRHQ